MIVTQKRLEYPQPFGLKDMTAAEIHDDVDVPNRNGAWGGATFTAAAQHRIWQPLAVWYV